MKVDKLIYLPAHVHGKESQLGFDQICGEDRRGDYVRVGMEDKNVSLGLETDMGVEWCRCPTMLAVLSHSEAVTLRDSPGAKINKGGCCHFVLEFFRKRVSKDLTGDDTQ